MLTVAPRHNVDVATLTTNSQNGRAQTANRGSYLVHRTPPVVVTHSSLADELVDRWAPYIHPSWAEEKCMWTSPVDPTVVASFESHEDSAEGRCWVAHVEP